MSKDHIYIRNTVSGEYEMFCTHCGDKYRPGLPIAAEDFLRTMREFKARHLDCPEPKREKETAV